MNSNFKVTHCLLQRPELIGLVVDSFAASAVKTIVSAEDLGVRQD
jgi:hypothetical protein